MLNIHLQLLIITSLINHRQCNLVLSTLYEFFLHEDNTIVHFLQDTINPLQLSRLKHTARCFSLQISGATASTESTQHFHSLPQLSPIKTEEVVVVVVREQSSCSPGQGQTALTRTPLPMIRKKIKLTLHFPETAQHTS